MVKAPFIFMTNKAVIFGSGKCKILADEVKKYGNRLLLIIGGASLEKGPYMGEITSEFEKKGIEYFIERVKGEPEPEMIDAITAKYSKEKIDIVAAIGGGSVIDSGKAVSAMLGKEFSVEEYLEGVGTKEHDGTKVPFIAVPTTAGTGSEATKNSVISRIGENGFKRSLRHDNFIPDCAIIDPDLMISCPPQVTAASGMDAFTQLLEAYTSPKGSVMSDMTAFEGMRLVAGSLEKAYKDGGNIEARGDMAIGAYLSGIALLNAGLGVVHGFASSVGGLYNIPHGVICGTLLCEAVKSNIEALKRNGDIKMLGKYRAAGGLFEGENDGIERLVDNLERLTKELKLPKLGEYGVKAGDSRKIAQITENKNNPVKLSTEEIEKIIAARI